jgi:hypothetical protein
MAQMKTKISAEQRSAILKLWRSGLKATEIAEKIGLSMPMVRSIIVRHEHADSWARKRLTPWEKSRAAEAASKSAMENYCKRHGWKFAFFEGATGSPRTGIIDAIMYRLGRKDSDILDLRMVQLKGGNAGVTGREITRLKRAAGSATVDWLIAELDGEVLHFLPEDPA